MPQRHCAASLAVSFVFRSPFRHFTGPKPDLSDPTPDTPATMSLSYRDATLDDLPAIVAIY
ncbi:MAG: hypothetical protein RXR52_27125, partial [Paraburkholderia sp.]